MRKRTRIQNKRRDKRVFSKTAAGSHPKNLMAGPMRGGFRLQDYKMPCYRPLKGYYARKVNKSGKRSLVFGSNSNTLLDVPIHVPCGRCIGCRLLS